MRYLIAALILLLSACSGGEDLDSAEKAIDRFHSELNAGNFERIHENAAPEWKKASSKADMVQLFQAVRNKLGPFVSGKQNGWRVNYTTGGTFVLVLFESKYQKGDATETFTFRRSGESAQLVGYNINSRALITG